MPVLRRVSNLPLLRRVSNLPLLPRESRWWRSAGRPVSKGRPQLDPTGGTPGTSRTHSPAPIRGRPSGARPARLAKGWVPRPASRRGEERGAAAGSRACGRPAKGSVSPPHRSPSDWPTATVGETLRVRRERPARSFPASSRSAAGPGPAASRRRRHVPGMSRHPRCVPAMSRRRRRVAAMSRRPPGCAPAMSRRQRRVPGTESRWRPFRSPLRVRIPGLHEQATPSLPAAMHWPVWLRSAIAGSPPLFPAGVSQPGDEQLRLSGRCRDATGPGLRRGRAFHDWTPMERGQGRRALRPRWTVPSRHRQACLRRCRPPPS